MTKSRPLGAVRTCIFTIGLAASTNAAALLTWINEIHYDNRGIDVGEFVEIAGAAGTDLSNMAVLLYNGASDADQEPYRIINLSGAIDDEGGSGYGAVAFLQQGIQNGDTQNASPDGLALVRDPGPAQIVLQFLSYEGTFSVNDIGTSTDIGVFEDFNTPVAHSLQLVGTGSTYGDFTWEAPAAESPGSLNAGQTIVPVPAAVWLFGSFLLGLIGMAIKKPA